MSSLTQHRVVRIAAPLAAMLLLAACQAGAGSSTAASQDAATPSPTVEASASAAESMEPAAGTVVVDSSDAVGDYLTDAEGNTLYIFLNDSPGETSCFDTCLQNWPAFTVDDGTTPEAGDGVTGALATIERDDGSLQVTLEDWPLYHFAGDSAPGDTNGEGVGDVWFVARPDGSLPAAASADPFNY